MWSCLPAGSHECDHLRDAEAGGGAVVAALRRERGAGMCVASLPARLLERVERPASWLARVRASASCGGRRWCDCGRSTAGVWCGRVRDVFCQLELVWMRLALRGAGNADIPLREQSHTDSEQNNAFPNLSLQI